MSVVLAWRTASSATWWLVTISPLALYNAVVHDLDLQNGAKPLVILDIATRHSDLVVAEGGSCWFRRLLSAPTRS